MRSFMVILLIAVFFLTGMVLGIDRGQDTASSPAGETTENDESMNSDQIAKEVTNQNDAEIETEVSNIMNVQEPVHFTQKMANFLETLVKGFYEIVVEIAYQIAQLFF